MTEGSSGGTNTLGKKKSLKHNNSVSSVCLCMIVRDESQVIRRCLDSVLPFITHWAIVDTGSTDSTIDLVKHALGNLPGKIRRQRWTGNFAFHRNASLALANQISADPNLRLLFIDADETLVVNDLAEFRKLIDGCSTIFWWARDGDWRFRKLAIVANKYVDKWIGVVHESLRLKPNARVNDFVQRAVEVMYGNDGIRRRLEGTYSSDIQLLSNKLSDNGGYRELMFLALTYEAVSNMPLASAYFRKASNANHSTADEHWQALWGLSRALLDIDTGEACRVLVEANRLSPHRAEPMVALAAIARSQGQFDEARLLAETALSCPEPNKTSMYDKSAYGWRAADELCLAAFSSADIAAVHRASAVYKRLIGGGDVPSTEHSRIKRNLELIQRSRTFGF